MLCNFHTHTTYCDGASLPEEIVLSAIEKGFTSLGFSEHGFVPFDKDCCIKNEDNYIDEILSLKKKYADKIDIYLGIEEDMYHRADRSKYEYMIGSMHYLHKDGVYFPLDLSYDKLKECSEAFGGKLSMAEAYYSQFVEYISDRKPDIVGHFDLITKFDEKNPPLFLGDKEYEKIAEKYLCEAIKSECIFEINTGAISRGHRTLPYPCENLLHILKKQNGKIILSSDSHHRDTLDCCFEESKKILHDIGFKKQYTLYKGEFKEIEL